MIRVQLLLALLATALAGCQSTARPIFPEINPPLVWPQPPDQPRIRYVGELRGEESLGIKPSGLESLRTVIAGSRAKVQFSRPSAVTVAGARVFVADTGLGVVHLLDLAARRYQVIAGSPSEPLQVPIDVTIASGDTLIVVDRARAAIDCFDLDGTWQKTERWPELSAPVAAAWDATGHVLWLVDAAAHACFTCADGSGALSSLMKDGGGRGAAPGQFNFPTAIAVQPQVGVVVVDAMNFRVQVLDETGQPRVVFGQKGDAAGDFARPRAVAIDSQEHIYVLDNQFENVQIFDRDGRLLMAFGHGGSGPGEFSLPSGITIDERDRIWIADSYNRRVQVFQYLPEEAPCLHS